MAARLVLNANTGQSAVGPATEEQLGCPCQLENQWRNHAEQYGKLFNFCPAKNAIILIAWIHPPGPPKHSFKILILFVYFFFAHAMDSNPQTKVEADCIQERFSDPLRSWRWVILDYRSDA
jgi:hypothetical protein